MKSSQILTISLGIAVIWGLSALETQAQAEGRKGGEFYKRLDKNGDEALSKSEIPAGMWERFSKLDKNGDETISKEELRNAMANRTSENADQKPTRDQRSQFFSRLDRNNDGKLVKDEVPAQVWERMSRADRDKDGVVSKEEIEQAVSYMQSMQSMQGQGRRGAGPTGPASVVSSFDENTDGKLTRNEVSADMWAKIAKLDTDSDGAVSQEELGKAYQN